MSQPPSQPPQPPGGAGAPQDPQQGMSKGPGQPPHVPPVPSAPPPAPPMAPPAVPPGTPPPPPAGYGYPQPGRPVSDNPYAQAQPGPYGQPGAPGQPPYGYPQQPQYPGMPAPGMPTGPAGPGSPFKGKPAVIIGAALAAVLVIGGGVWFATSGEDTEPKQPTAHGTGDAKPTGAGDETAGSRDGGEDDLNSGRKDGEARAWVAKNDMDMPQGGTELMNIWTVGDNVVQAAYKEVTAFKSSDGSKAWSVKLPHPVCDTPPRPSDEGMVVVAYKNSDNDEKSKCNQLQMIDLNTGEKGWQQQTNSGSQFDFTVTLDLEIAGENLMVARSQTGSAYRLKDGKEQYTLKKDGPCFPASFAADGDTLLGVDSCISSADKNEQLKSIDPKSGKVKWRFRTPKGFEVQKVYSVKPLVVSLVNRDDKSWNIVALKDNGKVRSQLDGGKETFTQRCGLSILEKELQSCQGMVATDDLFFMATEQKRSGDYDRSNEIIAFDLDTGKPKWHGRTEEPRSLLPLTAEDGKLIAYVEPSFDEAGQIVAFGMAGGNPKLLLQHPETTTSVENSVSGSGQLVYADGRFYATSSRVLGRDGEEETRMLSFGK